MNALIRILKLSKSACIGTLAICIFSALIMGYSSSVHAEQIRLGAMVRCPYICNHSATHPGILVEITQRIFSQSNKAVSVRFLPWARALRYAQVGELEGIIGVLRRNAPELVFPNLPQAVSINSFFTLVDRPWVYRGLKSLWEVRIGVTQGVSYGSMDSYIRRYQDTDRIQALSSENAISDNLISLARGRIDVILEDRYVLQYQKNLQTLPRIREQDQLTAENMYVAFSPKSPSSLENARLLTAGIDSLRRSGELDKIYEKYGLIENLINANQRRETKITYLSTAKQPGQ